MKRMNKVSANVENLIQEKDQDFYQFFVKKKKKVLLILRKGSRKGPKTGMKIGPDVWGVE